MNVKECKSKHHLGDRLVPISMFNKHAYTKDGFQSHCRDCNRRAQQVWYTAEKQKKNTETWWGKKRAILLEETGIDYSSYSAYVTQTLKGEAPEQYLLNRAKENAVRAGRPFDLTLTDIVIPDQCPVLNIPLFFSEDKMSENAPSVDRIDSNKGYTKENIVIVSWRANRIKNNGTPEEHKRIFEFYNPLHNARGHK